MSVSTQFYSLRWNLLVILSLIVLGSLPRSLSAQVRDRSDDTLHLSVACQTLSMPHVAGGLQLCINVDDLDFGGRPVGLPMAITLQFRICNTGDGAIHFLDPPIVWDDQHFFIDDSTMNALKLSVLHTGECLEIPVNFNEEMSGMFYARVKVNSTSECGRDTAIWRGGVYDAISVPLEGDIADEMSIAPNPAGGRNLTLTLGLTETRDVRIDILNMQGSTVATLIDEPLSTGRTLRIADLAPLPAGIYRIVMRTNGLLQQSQSLLIVR